MSFAHSRDSRVLALGLALVLAAVLAPATVLRADPRLPSSGVASAGGNVSSGSLQLTFAMGQTGGGPLSGGSIRAVAQWLRRSPAAVLDVGPPPGGDGAIRFASYPNPGSDRIVLRFSTSAPEAREVRLEIFDIAGRSVRRVAQGRYAVGQHEVVWDGRDAEGRRVPAGLYLCRLSEGATQHLRRLEIVH